MISKVPKKLVELVCSYLVKYYLPQKKLRHKADRGFNDRDLNFFAKGAGALSVSFTSGRSTLPKNYFNLKEYRAGYILYFTVTNYLKPLFCLDAIRAAENFKDGASILDIGTGPGTSLLAAADCFRGRPVKLVGVDQNGHILKDAACLLDSYAGQGAEVKTIKSVILPHSVQRTIGDKKFQIIFLSNFLSEIRNLNDRLSLVRTLAGKTLVPGGYFIIIEPALRHTSRDLMSFRDAFLERSGGGLHVHSPCLHESPCPMLCSNRRDWCHMYLDWERPEFIGKVDRIIGNKKDYLKFAYLIFAKSDEVRCEKNIWRVVSAPLRSRGKIELLLCGKGKLFRLVRLDRDRSDKNCAIETMKRGSIIEYGGENKVKRDSGIKIV